MKKKMAMFLALTLSLGCMGTACGSSKTADADSKKKNVASVTADEVSEEETLLSGSHIAVVGSTLTVGNGKTSYTDYLEKKNIITRAVGVSAQVDTDLFALKLKSGDQILMCSDGLSNMVDELEIEYIIRSEDGVESRAKALVDAANRSGGLDNISVVLVEPQISEVSL